MAVTGKLIRKARVEQGLSQTTVAEKLGVSQVTVSNWETDKSRPSAAQLKVLKEWLGFETRGRRPKRENGSDRVEDGVPAYGRWLLRARVDAGMTVPELAGASGVSVPAVYNIESGRSANPRENTRKKLEAALRQAAPQEVVESAEDASTIEGLGQLSDFDPYSKDDRPTCGGVYMFYDVSDRPVYVGKASNIARRVKDHEDKFWFKPPIVSNGAYVQIDDDDLRHQVEQVLIRFLKSNAVINRQSVER